MRRLFLGLALLAACACTVPPAAEAGFGCGVGVVGVGFQPVAFQPVAFRKAVSVQKVKRNGTVVNVNKVR